MEAGRVNTLKVQIRIMPGANEARLSIIIDDEVLRQHSVENASVIDAEEIYRSLDKDGEFYFFTCTCGNPGCANEEHTEVKHTNDKVYWKVVSDRGKKIRSFVFTRENYEGQVGKTIKKYIYSNVEELIKIYGTQQNY